METLYVAELDLSDAYAIEDEISTIIKVIKRAKLYSRRLLYRGFNGEYLNDVLELGTDIPRSEVIWCAKEDELCEPESSPLTYLSIFGKPAISFYDGRRLKEDPYAGGPYGYKPIHGSTFKDAVVGVFKLRYPYTQW